MHCKVLAKERIVEEDSSGRIAIELLAIIGFAVWKLRYAPTSCFSTSGLADEGSANYAFSYISSMSAAALKMSTRAALADVFQCECEHCEPEVCLATDLMASIATTRTIMGAHG